MFYSLHPSQISHSAAIQVTAHPPRPPSDVSCQSGCLSVPPPPAHPTRGETNFPQRSGQLSYRPSSVTDRRPILISYRYSPTFCTDSGSVVLFFLGGHWLKWCPGEPCGLRARPFVPWWCPVFRTRTVDVYGLSNLSWGSQHGRPTRF